MPQTYQSAYNNQVAIKHFIQSKALQLPEIRLLQILQAQLSQLKMLDIGVGAGRTTLYFAPLVKEYAGIDCAPGMIDYCQNNLPQYTDNATFQVGDVTNLSNFDNDYFDLVLFSFNGLDSLEKPARIKGLQEMQRVCKPGGWVFFSTHNLKMINYFYQPKIHPNSKKQKREDEKRSLIINNNDNPELILQQDDYMFFDGAFMKFAVDDIVRQYFIKPLAQIKQLENLGFRETSVFSIETGKPIEDWQLLENIQDHWLYYLCRV